MTPAMAMTNHTPPSDSLGWGWPLGLGLAFLGRLLGSRELPGTWSASKVAAVLGQEAASLHPGNLRGRRAGQLRYGTRTGQVQYQGSVSGLTCSAEGIISTSSHSHSHTPSGQWVPEQ